MTWDEVDTEDRLWTVPASRMKAGREHRVPVSGRAAEVLAEAEELRQNDLVFPSATGRRMSDSTMRHKAEAAYARTDLVKRRRELMEAWARYLSRRLGQLESLGESCQRRKRGVQRSWRSVFRTLPGHAQAEGPFHDAGPLLASVLLAASISRKSAASFRSAPVSWLAWRYSGSSDWETEGSSERPSR